MNKYKDWVVRYYASHDNIPEGHTDGEFMEELIRCKDCEYHRNRINMCDIWHRHTNGEGYCHRAKAKSKEQKAKCKAEE